MCLVTSLNVCVLCMSVKLITTEESMKEIIYLVIDIQNAEK